VATVNFCERCNAMGKSNAMDVITVTTKAVWSGEKEICPGCREDFETFWKGDAVPALADVERPKSYTERWNPDKRDPLADLSDDEIARAYLARVAARESTNELTAGSDGTV